MEFPFVTLVGFLVICSIIVSFGVVVVDCLSVCCLGLVCKVAAFGAAVGKVITLVVAAVVFWGAPSWDILPFLAKGAILGWVIGAAIGVILAISQR